MYDMKHKLPELPYDLDALEPLISRETLDYHYNKHHAGYVNKLNGLINDSDYEELSLEEIIHESKQGSNIFNNAAQIWNHTFYWHSMMPDVQTKPGKKLIEKIDRDFGSLDNLKEKFLNAAKGQFGSGWAWLVRNRDGSLGLETTGNADTVIRQNKQPLLVCDVWEHAYYIDYRNNRPEYLEQFWKLINWEFVEKNYLGEQTVQEKREMAV